jgi:membrane protein implicated in regulation of membrane protease activity
MAGESDVKISLGIDTSQWSSDYKKLVQLNSATARKIGRDLERGLASPEKAVRDISEQLLRQNKIRTDAQITMAKANALLTRRLSLEKQIAGVSSGGGAPNRRGWSASQGRGSYGNAGRRNQAAIQQGIFAIDDFATSLGTGGFSGAVRGASNNITQMASLLGGPWTLGIGVALTAATQLALAFWDLGEAEDEAKKRTEELARAEKQLAKEREAAERGFARGRGEMALGGGFDVAAGLSGPDAAAVAAQEERRRLGLLSGRARMDVRVAEESERQAAAETAAIRAELDAARAGTPMQFGAGGAVNVVDQAEVARLEARLSEAREAEAEARVKAEEARGRAAATTDQRTGVAGGLIETSQQLQRLQGIAGGGLDLSVLNGIMRQVKADLDAGRNQDAEAGMARLWEMYNNQAEGLEQEARAIRFGQTVGGRWNEEARRAEMTEFFLDAQAAGATQAEATRLAQKRFGSAGEALGEPGITSKAAIGVESLRKSSELVRLLSGDDSSRKLVTINEQQLEEQRQTNLLLEEQGSSVYEVAD